MGGDGWRATRDMCQTAVNHKILNKKSSLNLWKWWKIILGNNGWWRVTRDICQTAVKHDYMNIKYGLNSLKWWNMVLDNKGGWRMTRDMCQTAVNHKNLNRKSSWNLSQIQPDLSRFWGCIHHLDCVSLAFVRYKFPYFDHVFFYGF